MNHEQWRKALDRAEKDAGRKAIEAKEAAHRASTRRHRRLQILIYVAVVIAALAVFAEPLVVLLRSRP